MQPYNLKSYSGHCTAQMCIARCCLRTEKCRLCTCILDLLRTDDPTVLSRHMHFVICIIRVFVCRAICNVLVGWRTGEPIVTLPHIMHCVFKVKAAEMELLVEWLLGGPVNQLCFHTRTLLCQQHSRNHFEKGFFNILVLIKGVWMQMFKIQKPRPTLCISACIEKLIIWRNCGVIIMMRSGQEGNQSITKKCDYSTFR